MTRFHAIVAGRNCEDWVIRCLNSLADQRRPFDSIHVIDDASTDRTWDAVIDWAEGVEDTFAGALYVSHNTERQGALANQCRMIERARPALDDVLVFVDLDDRLAGPGVLVKLESMYSNPEMDCTYGSYEPSPESATCPRPTSYPPAVVRERSFRRDAYKVGLLYNHLRTFRYRPFAKIDQDLNFKWPDGTWFSVATDTAMMVPVLELSRTHAFIPDVLYVYNSTNPRSDWRVAADEIERTHTYILQTLQPLHT